MCCIHGICILAPGANVCANVWANVIFHPVVLMYQKSTLLASDDQFFFIHKFIAHFSHIRYYHTEFLKETHHYGVFGQRVAPAT